MSNINTNEQALQGATLSEVAQATKPEVKKDAVTKRSSKPVSRNVVVFNEKRLGFLSQVAEKISSNANNTGVSAPPLSAFIGEDAVLMVVDNERSEFTIKNRAKDAITTTKKTIAFGTKQGKELINFLMFVMPHFSADYRASEEYMLLCESNLMGRLNARAAMAEKKARPGILMKAMTMPDVYVVKNNVVLGKLVDMDDAELFDDVFEKDDSVKEFGANLRTGVEFVIAKDVRLTMINSPYTLWQKQTSSLSISRFAEEKNKKVETILVEKTTQQNGIKIQLKEPLKVIVMDELISLDANKLPFDDYNGAIAKAVFTKINVIHREDGVLNINDEVKVETLSSFKSYMKSTSMARNSGAVAFRSQKDVVSYFSGTGQDETAYMKVDKDADGVETGFNVMSVSKAYKRFMLAMSNGKTATTGLLSNFSTGQRVKFIPAGARNVIGQIRPAYIEITNQQGEMITIALINDFEAQVQRKNNFLLNRLDETNALVGIEKFNHWDNKDAIKALLTRNLTDGSGWVSSRITGAARKAGLLNSFDAFQLRVSNAIKGAVHEFDDMCELFGADIVLTEGMVKAEDIVSDLTKNGFQLYVVGQRKDGVDGAWIASQALQQFYMTESEMIESINETIKFSQDAIDNNFVGDLLTLMGATEDITDGEYVSVDYLRMAEEHGDVLDEQYIRDEIVSHAVKKLNKLLDSKLFVPHARNRYMFTDPLALLNAAKDGRYNVTEEDAVLKEYEVVAASKKDNKFFMEIGEAASNRFPITITHEAPIVNAVAPDEYQKYIDAGLWQGCTFFDVLSWVVAQQAGADHDGDASALIFDKKMIAARKRKNKELFGGLEVLPLIDAYVKYKDGVAVEFDMGCPTYTSGKEVEEETVEKMEMINGFHVQGHNIYAKPYEFTGTKGEKRRLAFLNTVAEISHEITVNTIETSLIGVIANRAMILTDFLSKTDSKGNLLLSKEELAEVQRDLLHLTTAGRWEIDRPKHGGAYMQMPLIEELFAKFKSVTFSDAQKGLSKERQLLVVQKEKGVYAGIFFPTKIDGQIVGFRVKKPHWLASQKDEYGVPTKESIFNKTLIHANKALQEMCVKYSVGHSDTAKNHMRPLIRMNMEMTAEVAASAQFYVNNVYEAYKAKEKTRQEAETQFKADRELELKEAGHFAKKDMDSLTKAKKNSKIRKLSKEDLFQFTTDRELFKTELRKEIYVLAKKLGVDVRNLVGMLYLIINSQKGTGTASHVKDGREYRFVASNSFISLPFEVFVEEMTSLISGKISETYFFPLNTSFAMIETSLVQEGEVTESEQAPAYNASNTVRANVFAPSEAHAGKTVTPNRSIRIAVRLEQTKTGAAAMVMYFLKGSCQKEDLYEITKEDALYAGIAPNTFYAGISAVNVNTIAFNNEGNVANITFS